jgi:hypothetical protein
MCQKLKSTNKYSQEQILSKFTKQFNEKQPISEQTPILQPRHILAIIMQQETNKIVLRNRTTE